LGREPGQSVTGWRPGFEQVLHGIFSYARVSAIRERFGHSIKNCCDHSWDSFL
jgi:hypothetical protein